MTEQIIEGGIIATGVVIILREVFSFLKTRNGNGPVTRTEFQAGINDLQTKSTCEQIVRRFEEGREIIHSDVKEIKSDVKALMLK